jgi:hypothetical protein
MKKPSVDDIIEDLQQDLKPCERFAHPLVSVLPALILIPTLIFGVAYFLIGLRADISELFTAGNAFYLEAFVGIGLSVSALLALAWMRFPDMRQQRWILYPVIPFFCAFLWIVFMTPGDGGFGLPQWMWHNIFNGFLMITLPIIGLVYWTRKGWTTNSVLCGIMMVLAITGFGWIGIRFTCPMDNYLHTFLYNLVPFSAAGIFAGLLARRLFHW